MPGTTSSSEALAILEANPYVRKGTLVQNGTPVLGGARWYWRVSGYRLPSGLTWQNDRVREIVLGLPYHVEIAQIIEKYGPPEALIATSGGIPENRYWIIDLLYPQLGLQFKTYTADDSAIISPTTEVGAAYYFAPTTLNTRLEAYYGHNASTESNIGVEFAREWNGYGDLFDKYYTSPEELLVDE